MIDFTPCAEKCPALTGSPFGSVRYCPMAEHARHRGDGASCHGHADYTDCCANFQCCEDIFEAAGLGSVAEALSAGGPPTTVAKVDDGYAVLSRPPTSEDV